MGGPIREGAPGRWANSRKSSRWAGLSEREPQVGGLLGVEAPGGWAYKRGSSEWDYRKLWVGF